jgi:hypothetical protein
MPQAHSLPEHISLLIQRPACSRCQTQMMLARIMPVRMGFDCRTYECPKCDNVHEVMVATGASGT